MQNRKIKRHVELSQNINCYFTEGWSAQFQRNLTNFAVYLWGKYAKRDVDFDEFHSEFILKVYTKLQEGNYDPEGANFGSYLHTLGRGVATTLVQYAKTRGLNDNFSYTVTDEYNDDELYMKLNLRADNQLHSVENVFSFGKIDEEHFSYFLSVVKKRGLQVEEQELRRDLYNYVPTPLTEAYAYIAVRGARYA